MPFLSSPQLVALLGPSSIDFLVTAAAWRAGAVESSAMCVRPPPPVMQSKRASARGLSHLHTTTHAALRSLGVCTRARAPSGRSGGLFFLPRRRSFDLDGLAAAEYKLARGVSLSRSHALVLLLAVPNPEFHLILIEQLIDFVSDMLKNEATLSLNSDANVLPDAYVFCGHTVCMICHCFHHSHQS